MFLGEGGSSAVLTKCPDGKVYHGRSQVLNIDCLSPCCIFRGAETRMRVILQNHMTRKLWEGTLCLEHFGMQGRFFLDCCWKTVSETFSMILFRTSQIDNVYLWDYDTIKEHKVVEQI